MTLPLDDPTAVLLDVPYVDQGEYAELCWAACCAMVIEFKNLAAGTSICQLATEAFHVDCCPDASSDACDQPHWPDDIYAKHFRHPLAYEDALTLANVVYEINNKRPVNAILQWLGGDGSDQGKHSVLICGYYDNGDVLVQDPDPATGVCRVGFDYVATAYNSGRWCKSYYNLEP